MSLSSSHSGSHRILPDLATVVPFLVLLASVGASLAAGSGTLIVANKSDHTVDLIDVATGAGREPDGMAYSAVEVSGASAGS